jgi:membrane protease YdiL (CAAX protease family)
MLVLSSVLERDAARGQHHSRKTASSLTMADSPLTVPVEPPAVGFFRNPDFAFVLLRLFLYLVLTEAFTYEFLWISNFFEPNLRSALSPSNLMTSECLRFAGIFAAAWVMSRLEKRSFGDYGLPLRAALGRRFWQGAAFGLFEISAVLATLAAMGYYHFGFVEIHGVTLFRWLAFWLVFFLVVGLFEEFAFRGYAQFALTQGTGFWWASIATSLTFGAVHLTNPGESWTGIAGVVLTGLFWCFTLRRTGSLWFAVGMHAAFDFGETFLYSVPDSGMIFPGHLSSATLTGPAWLTGGSAGPEASFLDFLILLSFFYIFHRLFPLGSKNRPVLDETSPTRVSAP